MADSMTPPQGPPPGNPGNNWNRFPNQRFQVPVIIANPVANTCQTIFSNQADINNIRPIVNSCNSQESCDVAMAAYIEILKKSKYVGTTCNNINSFPFYNNGSYLIH